MYTCCMSEYSPVHVVFNIYMFLEGAERQERFRRERIDARYGGCINMKVVPEIRINTNCINM